MNRRIENFFVLNTEANRKRLAERGFSPVNHPAFSLSETFICLIPDTLNKKEYISYPIVEPNDMVVSVEGLFEAVKEIIGV